MKTLFQVVNIIEKLCIIFISLYHKDRIGKGKNSMATTVINKDNNNNNNNNNNNEKTMLEGMLEFEARYPKLFEALAKDDKSLIRK